MSIFICSTLRSIIKYSETIPLIYIHEELTIIYQDELFINKFTKVNFLLLCSIIKKQLIYQTAVKLEKKKACCREEHYLYYIILNPRLIN